MAKQQVLKGKEGYLFAAILGLVASDIIPTPGDAGYFWLHKKFRDKWAKGEYTAKQYWFREALIYYTLNAAWWAIVGTAIYFTPGDFKKKLRTGLILAGSGVLVFVLAKIIKKDELDGLSEIQEKKQILFDNHITKG